MVSRTACCWSGVLERLTSACGRWLLNIQELVSQLLLNHLLLENAHSGSIYTTIISRHYKSLFFLKEKCVPFTALTMAPFFSTPSHKTHLSLLFREQSGCSELMGSRVLGWEYQSFTCHPVFPSRGTVLRGTLIDQIAVHQTTLLTSLSPSTVPSLNFLSPTQFPQDGLFCLFSFHLWVTQLKKSPSIIVESQSWWQLCVREKGDFSPLTYN